MYELDINVWNFENWIFSIVVFLQNWLQENIYIFIGVFGIKDFSSIAIFTFRVT